MRVCLFLFSSVDQFISYFSEHCGSLNVSSSTGAPHIENWGGELCCKELLDAYQTRNTSTTHPYHTRSNHDNKQKFPVMLLPHVLFNEINLPGPPEATNHSPLFAQHPQEFGEHTPIDLWLNEARPITRLIVRVSEIPATLFSSLSKQHHYETEQLWQSRAICSRTNQAATH